MNREFAFYCPELDCIVIQHIMDGCHIVFEWDLDDFLQVYEYLKDTNIDDPLEVYSLMPLGEV